MIGIIGGDKRGHDMMQLFICCDVLSLGASESCNTRVTLLRKLMRGVSIKAVASLYFLLVILWV